jgi:hypothetical protein
MPKRKAIAKSGKAKLILVNGKMPIIQISKNALPLTAEIVRRMTQFSP